MLGNAKVVESMLQELIGILGMRMLGEPHLYEVETEIAKLGVEPFEDEGGVTGVCVLSTSHCAIHTWPLRPYFVMDVFSCRDFEPSAVEGHLAKRLGAYDVQLTDLSFSLVHQPERPSSPPGRKPRRSGRDAVRGWAKTAS
ncbi:MAG TPA: S-adenosylmethionine decarboxylase [Polyangiaceae bacterium]